MKKTSEVRATGWRAESQCAHCSWRALVPSGVRAPKTVTGKARAHVGETGHTVNVTVTVIRTYVPKGAAL